MSDDLIDLVARAIRVALAANQGVEADVNSPMTPNEKRAYLPVARACLAELSAAGYAVVPVEATVEMEDAGQEIIGPCYVNELMADPGKVWSAMIARAALENTHD